MSETTPETVAATTTTTTTESEWKPPASQAELDRIISDRLARQKAAFKDYDDLKTKAAEFDKFTEAQKTEAQKAADRAEKAEAKAVAATQRAVKAEIKSIATGEFVAPDRVHMLLGDLSQFVDANGDPDPAAIETALKALEKEAPELVARTRTDAGLGPRGGGAAQSPHQFMNQNIRQAAGR